MKARLNKPGFSQRLSENFYRQSEKYDEIGRMMYFREVGRLEGRNMKLEEEIKCKKAAGCMCRNTLTADAEYIRLKARKTMIEYKAVYKCRLCGEKFENGLTAGGKSALKCMNTVLFGIPCDFLTPHREEQHICADGSYGIADFCGFAKHGADDKKEQSGNG